MCAYMTSLLKVLFSSVCCYQTNKIIDAILKKTYSLFIKHPHSEGKSYIQHLKETQRRAFWIFIVFLVMSIHSIFPFLFIYRSDQILKNKIL